MPILNEIPYPVNPPVSKNYFLNYSRVDANPPHPNIKVEVVAHEAVVNSREPSQPNPGYNEGFVVRSAG